MRKIDWRPQKNSIERARYNRKHSDHASELSATEWRAEKVDNGWRLRLLVFTDEELCFLLLVALFPEFGLFRVLDNVIKEGGEQEREEKGHPPTPIVDLFLGQD